MEAHDVQAEDLTIGVVERVEDGLAHVRLSKNHDCHKCGACLHNSMDNTVLVAVRNEAGAKEGDRVEIAFRRGARFQATLLAYALPLLLLILGVAAGQTLGGDVWAAILGFTFAASAFVYLRISEKRRSERGAFRPVLTRVIQ